MQTSPSQGLSCSQWSQAMGQSGPWLLSLGSGGEVQSTGVAVADGGIFSHRKKCLSDRHRVSKNSLAESLMALGIIANVRGRGVLEFAQVAERESCHRLGGGPGAKPGRSECFGGLWNGLGISSEVKK